MSLTESRIRELCEAAIQEAKQSLAEDDRPHPLVGAILADQEGNILVRAHRGERTKWHAEYLLLEKARQRGVNLGNSILFVTLEPCSRRGSGKVPCAVRVRESGIKKVYIGALDPDPNITGRGETYLSYEGIAIEHFPSDLAADYRSVSSAFFDRFRAAHFWEAPAKSLYGAGGAVSTKPRLSSNREVLLYQSLDLMIGSDGPIWVAAGNMSWLRELQVAFLSAALNKRSIRVLKLSPNSGNGADAAVIASSLGMEVALSQVEFPIRFTLVNPEAQSATGIFIERDLAQLYQAPDDERMLALLRDWHRKLWEQLPARPASNVRIESIPASEVIDALKTHIPQYRNLAISLCDVPIANLKPATRTLERFKLARINQFIALAGRHGLPEFARICGSPWPLLGRPIVEQLPDGTMVLIDGTHRAYSALARGSNLIPVILVQNPNFDLPSQPAANWDEVRIQDTKLSREIRYRNYQPRLFRPVRKAVESLA